MYSASFKTNNEFVTSPAYALNQGFHWQNYVDSWTRGNMTPQEYRRIHETGRQGGAPETL